MQFQILIWTIVATAMAVESAQVPEVDSDVQELLRHRRAIWDNMQWPWLWNEPTTEASTTPLFCPEDWVYSSMLGKCIEANMVCQEGMVPNYYLGRCVFIEEYLIESTSTNANL
ncbi:Hypothetical protein CINCED_3A019082 [Cinara cedri]|uniref:Secreted protein n=1 Tax=Cinara cedri TaxID=506608 RepID=A0A5E4NC85_9HEMI|nr:Hypothetical protein CINCED_3A019082 [Cinara cedri]